MPATTEFLSSLLTFSDFSLFSFSVPIVMSSASSNLSRSGGLRYAPRALDVYLHEYKNYMEIRSFNAMTLNGDAGTVNDTVI